LGRLDHAKRIDQVRGFEGSGTSAYFRALGYLLQGEMEFTRRTRNPPLDPVNSLLSFGYTLVLHNMYSYICARGLYPGVGILHSPGHGHPALASDLIEEFRAPIVDGLVLGLVNRRQVQKADFYFGDGEPQPCLMRDETRKLFIEAFEERLAQPVSHPDVDHPVDWRRVMDLQVGRFRRFVEGKLKAYTPYMVGAEE
jgi:CRISPR-associated protein Cas1